MSKETMFDSRLFNQSHGMSAGFGAEDDYNLYDKPLFSGSSAAAIYRPKRSEEASIGGVSADRIEKIVEGKPHRGFKGADATDAPRDGPVQFEKEVDPFGFSEFMGSAKRGRETDGGETVGDSSKRSRA
jgi:SNW domain-containing protein 1